MSSIIANRVEKPAFFRLVPLKRGRGHRKVVVVGFDTEAIKGKARMLQFNSEGDENSTTIYRPSMQGVNAALSCFIEYLDTYCTRKDTEYIIVGWNLVYEWSQLFPDLPISPETGLEISKEPKFIFNTGRVDASGNLLSRWQVTALNDKRYTATFVHLGTKRRIRLLDGMAFFVTSLDKAGAMLGLGGKVAMSKDRLAHLTETDLDDPYFISYARWDAYLTRRIGEVIVDYFTDYDVPTCISAPQFAARVFRHHFLDGEIPMPSPDLEQAGLSSYHGGKNGYYLNGPKHLSKVWSYDITSAYPEAMKAIPNPVTAQWFPVDDWVPGRHALYRVTMEYTGCRYRGAQEHDGRKLSPGYVDGVWITSYELDAIMAHKEARLIAVKGYQMVGEGGGSLSEYVDRFFALKAKSTGAIREAAKLFLNSLYGKFFQKTPLGNTGYWMIESDDAEPYIVHNDGEYDWQAGGLYHPPIASLITGYVRGKIHHLEHKYTSVMTSTDGFFARSKPDPADLGKHLGGLTAKRGDLSIWRERLYVFDDGTSDHHECDPGCKADHRKAALHGFRGRTDDLMKIPLVPGSFGYTATQLVTLRLAGRTFTGADGAPITPDVGQIPTLKYMLDIRGSPT